MAWYFKENGTTWAVLNDEFPDYAVSEDGRVAKISAHRMLSLTTDRIGYVHATMMDKDGKWHNCLVHRMVGKAFIANPEGLPEINHKDEDKANNNAGNLEWCTKAYNNVYGTRGARIAAGRMGGDNPAAKAVTVNGVRYGSIIEASTALGMTYYEFKKLRIKDPEAVVYA